MSISRLRRVLGLVCSLALIAAHAQPGGAESGSVPYAVLYQTLKAAHDGATRPHLRIVPHISSHIAGVKPESIRLVVQSAQGPRPVNVTSDGAIAFPLEDALLAENPTVTTNQPKGSLTLGVTLELVVPQEPRWACAEILAALAESEPVIAEMPARNPAAGVRGIEFFFGSRKDAQIVVRGRSERLLQADDDGRIVLMRDADLSEPGAVLEFSALPLRAQPYLAP